MSPSPPVSAQEEEAMSSAYIAQLLAQEEAYAMTADAYDLYGDYDDYRPSKAHQDDDRTSAGRKRRPKRADSDWEGEDAEEEEDYQPKPGRRRRGGGTVRGRRPVTTPTRRLAGSVVQSPSNDQKENNSNDTPTIGIERSATNDSLGSAVAIDGENVDTTAIDSMQEPSAKKARRVRPKIEGMNQGAYTPEEEERFLNGLETYGRGWNDISQYIGTRDSHSVRSHAQKYFIRLFRDNKQLPEKVRESGQGYTLSGLSLDPESAAARTYLARYDPLKKTAASEANALGISLVPVRVEKVTPNHLADDNQVDSNSKNNNSTVANEENKPLPEVMAFGQTPTPLKTRINQARLRDSNEENTEPIMQEPNAMKDNDLTTITPRKIAMPKPLMGSGRRVGRPSSTASLEPAVPVGADGRTDYSRNRPQRRVKPSVNFSQLAVGADPLTMVKCDDFSGPPGSGVAGAQPFSVTVRPSVLVGMDFHAHLMHTEIIGFLAGRWIPEKKVLEIHDCFPCRSLPIDQEHMNVEMDPTSECEVRQEIASRQLQVVGWYHSHPTFLPDPSLVDLENQRNYQQLFRDVECDEEPFVGAIVGPYDTRLPGSASVINWFYVSRTADERGHPKRLRYDLSDVKDLSEDRMDALLRLTDEYQFSPDRVRLQERWRQDRDDSRMDKMFVSLLSRTPREDTSTEDPSVQTDHQSIKDSEETTIPLPSPPTEETTSKMDTEMLTTTTAAMTIDTKPEEQLEECNTTMDTSLTEQPMGVSTSEEEIAIPSDTVKEIVMADELTTPTVTNTTDTTDATTTPIVTETTTTNNNNNAIPLAYQTFFDRARTKLLNWC
ncbi:hypothetical protein BDF19DRAFT_444731 [Syncephalis fuscata]|nr:hypothetical protein BDF19DRAFT_444731 [Syncephalis fuscata]